jgi:hypothetical protein
MRAYFQRRKERHKSMMEKETPLQTQVRLNREKSQATKQLPGKKGPTVFYWEKKGERDIRIRTRLSRADAKFSWSQWSNKDIVYDSFNNEYDCCSEWSFDPEDTAAPSQQRENEFSDDELDDYNSGLPTDLPADLPNAIPPVSEVQDVLMHDIRDTRHLLIPPVDLPVDLPDAAPPVLEVQDVPMHDIRDTDLLIPPVGLTMDLPVAAPPVLEVQDVPMHDIRDTDLLIPPVGLTMDLPVAAPPVLEVQDVSMHDIRNTCSTPPPLLCDISKQNASSVLLLMPTVQPSPKPQSIEDLIYYRYGYSLNETPYQGSWPAFAESPNHFEHWFALCSAVGGKGLSDSGGGRAPITDFLVALLASKDPFHDVPGKYWDLSPGNGQPLKSFTPIHLCITIREFQGGALCLLQSSPRIPLTADWYIAVEPMTGLECIRHALGPSLIDVAQFLLDEGIPFRTLTPSSESPRRTPSPTPSRQLLGSRPYQYKFDIADFATYETIRESFLKDQPQGRRALCYGGIVGRLARETLPDSAALAGPSDSALQGEQGFFQDGGDFFVDDQLSDRELDLICGTYDVGTGKPGMSTFPCCANLFIVL